TNPPYAATDAYWRFRKGGPFFSLVASGASSRGNLSTLRAVIFEDVDAAGPPVGHLPKLVKRSIVAIKTLMKRGRARFWRMASPRDSIAARPTLTSAISAVVDFCIGRPWWILGWAFALAAASGIYAAGHFAIKTDIHELISHDLPWAKRAIQYMRTFPQFGIIVVIDAPTPELAEHASTELTRALQAHPERFLAVSHPGSGKFFEQHG